MPNRPSVEGFGLKCVDETRPKVGAAASICYDENLEGEDWEKDKNASSLSGLEEKRLGRVDLYGWSIGYIMKNPLGGLNLNNYQFCIEFLDDLLCLLPSYAEAYSNRLFISHPGSTWALSNRRRTCNRNHICFRCGDGGVSAAGHEQRR